MRLILPLISATFITAFFVKHYIHAINKVTFDQIKNVTILNDWMSSRKHRVRLYSTRSSKSCVTNFDIIKSLSTISKTITNVNKTEFRFITEYSF